LYPVKAVDGCSCSAEEESRMSVEETRTTVTKFMKEIHLNMVAEGTLYTMMADGRETHGRDAGSKSSIDGFTKRTTLPVQMRDEGNARSEIRGQIKHVPSGQLACFREWSSLEAFLTQECIAIITKYDQGNRGIHPLLVMNPPGGRHDKKSDPRF
jgi:hypothetical protein